MRAVDLIHAAREGQVEHPVELFPAHDAKTGVRHDVLDAVAEDSRASFVRVEVDGKRYIVTVTEDQQ